MPFVRGKAFCVQMVIYSGGERIFGIQALLVWDEYANGLGVEG